MATGYCTVEDVRRALRKADLPGDAQQDRDIVIDAIAGTSGWLRKSLNAHFYVPGGITEDSDGLVPTDVRERGPEEKDIPSTPHPQHSTLFQSRRGRYPHRTNGPWVQIQLDKRSADTITTLDVRDADGDYTDWISDPSYTQGDDYRLNVGAGTPAPSSVELHGASVGHLRHYENAVRVTYDYGIDELPRTVRRAAAFKAAEELAEDAVIQIPANAEVYNVETLADFFARKAEEKLDQYR